MAIAAPQRAHTDAADDRSHISRLPYLPGLDGMRALAVVAVMVYHANSDWLHGGFLGVEMFFVISGYLITLLLIAERERTYRVSLKHFWLRRARRLLPAVILLMLLLSVWTALFEREALGQLRGDVLAGLFYVSNYYQIWVGLGYTAAGDFAPLRHLWSLAVEEQFYLVWPLIMAVILRKVGTRRVADVSRWIFLAAVLLTATVAVLFYAGPIGEPAVTPQAYWWIGDRPISKVDTLYLGTLSRAAALMLGSAFAMVWRPYAVARGPLRTKGRLLDVVAVGGLVVLGWMCWNVSLITPQGADPQLFRGGFFIASVATLMVIAAVAHRGAYANRLLGTSVLVWIGVRSYGLYLFHWPIYQIIRGVAGNKLNLREFGIAMALTVLVTELSFRLVETPIRSGRFMESVRRIRRQPNRGPRRLLTLGIVGAVVLAIVAGAALVTAPLQKNAIARELEAGEEFTTDLGAAPSGAAGDAAQPGTTIAADAGPATTRSPSTTTAPRNAVSTTVGAATTVAPGAQPATTAAAPTSAAPVVPATTQPPAPPPATAARSLGLVTDVSQLQRMEVPPTTGYHRLIALGDSVMLGAAEELQALGFAVDAVKSRQMIDFVPTMQQIRADGTFGSVAVVHLGTNGPFSQDTLNSMMATLVDVPIVLLFTSKADRSWVPGNNEKTRALVNTYPNVTVIDWEVLSRQCPGTCFYEDGIHLTDSGQQFYAGLVKGALAI